MKESELLFEGEKYIDKFKNFRLDVRGINELRTLKKAVL